MKSQTLDTSALVQALLKSPAPSEVFVFSKRLTTGDVHGRVRIKLLSMAEQDDALACAQAYAKSKGEGDGYGDIYREAQALELCSRVLCHETIEEREDGTMVMRPLFTDVSHMRKAFNAADCAQVLNMYELVKARFGSVEQMTQGEYDVWSSRLADSLMGPHFLSRLDSGHWPSLILELARQVSDLRAEVKRPLSNWADTFESDQSSLPGTTGSFSGLPEASSEDGVELPISRLLSAKDAAELLKKKPPKE